MDTSTLIGQFMSLAGMAALIAALVNTLKKVGVVKDGDALAWATGFNLAGIVALFVLRVFAPQTDVGQIDQVASSIAQILTLVVGLVVQLGLTRGANEILRGAPVVGYSHSKEE